MFLRRRAGWIGAAVVIAAAAVASSEDSQGERYYQSRLAKLAKTAAARLWDAADRARKDSLFRFARDEARRVLDLDPDNHAARAFFGYVKKGDAWEIDSTLSAKVPTDNLPPPGAQKRDDVERAWRCGPAARADLDVAALYSSLGDECAAKGYGEQAKAAFAAALCLDADNVAAHKGLGHARLGDGPWFTAQASRAFEAGRVVRPLDEPSRYDELLGVKLGKAESGHFRVESPHPPAAIASYLEACERAYATYLADLALAPDTDVLPRAPMFCVMETQGQWDRWIDRMTKGNPGFYRGLTCHWARDSWTCAVRNYEGATELTRRDRLAHESAHMMSLALWSMPDGCWLDEALAHRCAVLSQGTTASYCVAPRREDYASAGATIEWTDQSQWRARLREIVAKNDDMALRKIVSKSAYELPLYASIKAWSVVDLLMRRDRAAFVAMLKDVAAEKSLPALLETRFGKDVETLDAEWRKWVMETY